jgi:enediyne biosynthesis protein E4
VGTESNRDAIGAMVRVFADGKQQTRLVRSGSSYLSQSELPVTIGVGKVDRIDRLVVEWPSGKTEQYQALRTGRAFQITENKGIAEDFAF